MASTQGQVYLITGANRGIGKALLTVVLSRPDVTVVAAVRDPASALAKELASLPAGQNSRLVTVKIDSSSETDALEAVQTLQTKYGIEHLDVVVSNAGISNQFGPVTSVTAAQLKDHITVNAVGPLLLFQAVYPLLKKSSQAKYVLIGSANGSIGDMEKFQYPTFAYGGSKALAHYLVRKIHFEHKDVIAFAICPGFVQSDMGNSGARMFGMQEAPVPLADSAKFLITEIDGATKEKTSGRFPDFDGLNMAW